MVINVSVMLIVRLMYVKQYMTKVIDPMGRFCLSTDSKMGRKCRVHADCESGNCKTIFDKDGHLVERRCTGAGAEPDNSYVFKDADTSKYGIVNSKYRDKLFKETKVVPTKFIAYVAEAVVSLIKGILMLLYAGS